MECYLNYSLFLDLHVTTGASAVNISDESKRIFMNDCSVRNCTSDYRHCVFLLGRAVYTSRLCFHRDWAEYYGQSLSSGVPRKTTNDNKAEEITVNQCPPNEEGESGSLVVWNGRVSFRNNNISFCKLREYYCLEIYRDESIPWEFVTLDSNEARYQLCWFGFRGSRETQTFWRWNIMNNGIIGKLFDGYGSVFQMEQCVIGNNRFEEVTDGEFICSNSFICSNLFSLKGRECTETWSHQNYRPMECFGDYFSLYLKEKEELHEVIHDLVKANKEKDILLSKMHYPRDFDSLKEQIMDSWDYY